MKTIYSIGHSTHQPDNFVALLKTHGIEAVYDVRSKPYSKFSPQFRRENLDGILREAGIDYVFMGDQLGGKPAPPPKRFAAGLDRLRQDADAKRFAVMCAEKDPTQCHRCWKIAQNLPDMEVLHIHGDGRLERHADLMARQAPQQMGLGF